MLFNTLFFKMVVFQYDIGDKGQVSSVSCL